MLRTWGAHGRARGDGGPPSLPVVHGLVLPLALSLLLEPESDKKLEVIDVAVPVEVTSPESRAGFGFGV